MYDLFELQRCLVESGNLSSTPLLGDHIPRRYPIEMPRTVAIVHDTCIPTNINRVLLK